MTITIYNSDGSQSKTLNDFGTITSFSIEEPEVELSSIEIPGRNGALDTSEALTSYPVYKNRKIEIKLSINQSTAALNESKTDELAAFLHGKKIRIVFDFISGYYFSGRCEMSVERLHPKIYNVTLKVDCEPYALKNSVTTKTIATGSLAVSSVMPTKMTVNATTEVSITRGTETSTYSVGTHRIDYPLLVGSETLTINSGTGTITYQEGKL